MNRLVIVVGLSLVLFVLSTDVIAKPKSAKQKTKLKKETVTIQTKQFVPIKDPKYGFPNRPYNPDTIATDPNNIYNRFRAALPMLQTTQTLEMCPLVVKRGLKAITTPTGLPMFVYRTEYPRPLNSTASLWLTTQIEAQWNMNTGPHLGWLEFSSNISQTYYQPYIRCEIDRGGLMCGQYDGDEWYFPVEGWGWYRLYRSAPEIKDFTQLLWHDPPVNKFNAFLTNWLTVLAGSNISGVTTPPIGSFSKPLGLPENTTQAKKCDSQVLTNVLALKQERVYIENSERVNGDAANLVWPGFANTFKLQDGYFGWNKDNKMNVWIGQKVPMGNYLTTIIPLIIKEQSRLQIVTSYERNIGVLNNELSQEVKVGFNYTFPNEPRLKDVQVEFEKSYSELIGLTQVQFRIRFSVSDILTGVAKEYSWIVYCNDRMLMINSDPAGAQSTPIPVSAMELELISSQLFVLENAQEISIGLAPAIDTYRVSAQGLSPWIYREIPVGDPQWLAFNTRLNSLRRLIPQLANLPEFPKSQVSMPQTGTGLVPMFIMKWSPPPYNGDPIHVWQLELLNTQTRIAEASWYWKDRRSHTSASQVSIKDMLIVPEGGSTPVQLTTFTGLQPGTNTVDYIVMRSDGLAAIDTNRSRVDIDVLMRHMALHGLCPHVNYELTDKNLPIRLPVNSH